MDRHLADGHILGEAEAAGPEAKSPLSLVLLPVRGFRTCRSLRSALSNPNSRPDGYPQRFPLLVQQRIPPSW